MCSTAGWKSIAMRVVLVEDMVSSMWTNCCILINCKRECVISPNFFKEDLTVTKALLSKVGYEAPISRKGMLICFNRVPPM